MAARKIILTPKAEEDLREIFLYLSNYSLDAADAQAGAILEKIDLLANFPRLGRILSDFNNDLLREMIVDSYSIAYYIVSEQQIDVVAIHFTGKRK
jgi:toxin ParE1/3/4